MSMGSRHFDLIYTLLEKELRARYKSYAFGFIWSLAQPMAFGLIYFLVFGIVMRVQVPNYPAFLVTGLFVWQWLSNSIAVGAMTFLGNAPLIKKVAFPRHYISLVVAMQDMVHFVLALPVIFFFLWYFDCKPQWSWLYGLPVLLFLQLMMAYALNLIVATLNLFFRDLERIIQVVLTMAFYLTPVVYSLDQVPERFRHLAYLNPFAMIVTCWRSVLLDGELPMNFLAAATVWTALFLVLAQAGYRRLVWRFAEVL